MRKIIARMALVGSALLLGSLPLNAFRSPATGYKEPVHLANLEDKRITESSGIVASRRTPGVFWTHNDSGDGPNLFATDKKGHALATFTVTGATNVDWEDIAAGPGKGENAVIYVGDIGDNGNNRKDNAVYRVVEPEVDPKKTGQTGRTMIAQKFPYVYPDGSHDAETLLVDPRNSEVYIITKTDSGLSGVYRFPTPMVRGLRATLEKVATLKFVNPLAFRGRNVGKLATGGDISPDATKIAIRTYTDGFEWTIKPGQTIPDALSGTPIKITVPWLGQYESFCYSLDGKSLFTTSEGVPCPLWEIPSK
jgi:hypothetical protein